MPLPEITHSNAIFSSCRLYRYVLTRSWRGDLPSICFVMLNPSAADETLNDPTIRRCLSFANDWGFGAMVAVNLFAYRTHDPAILKTAADPIGPENDAHIVAAIANCAVTVVAWGVYGHAHDRSGEVLERIVEPYCLGQTLRGAPRHPLYVKGGLRLEKFVSSKALTE